MFKFNWFGCILLSTALLPAPRGNLASGVLLNLKDGTIVVNADAFGPMGYGEADDAQRLQRADAYAESVRMPLYFGPHRYLYNSPLRLRALRWIGVAGRTQLIAGRHFAYNQNGTIQGTIYNEHFSGAFDSATCDAINIEGVTFVNDAPLDANGQRETLMLSNICHFTIQHNYFKSSGKWPLVDIDLWGPAQNGRICWNSIVQNTRAPTGGPFWILNLGDTDADATQHIRFCHNELSANSGDEMIGIASAHAPIRDIVVDHDTLKETGNPSAIFTVFGGQHLVTDLIALDLKIYAYPTTRAAKFVVRLGGIGGAPSSTRNVFIEQSNIQINGSGCSSMVDAIDAEDQQNVYIRQTRIESTGTMVAHGILGSRTMASMIYAEGNTITGHFGDALNSIANPGNNRVSLTK